VPCLSTNSLLGHYPLPVALAPGLVVLLVVLVSWRL
jgi:hypothetical protein